MGYKSSDWDLIWTVEAEKDVDAIYGFYEVISTEVALKIVTEIILEVEKIHFSEAFQVDDINSNYRRIIVRHYKILYREDGNRIIIFAVFDSRQNPKKLRNLKRFQ
ncbi:MAG: type II toxin-antitoxin system RelE/ParE family toxin [Flavobacterium sp.]|nr:type II toxin-antitoxin system RelE/ParE family toxin [Flavobacterium sp.]